MPLVAAHIAGAALAPALVRLLGNRAFLVLALVNTLGGFAWAGAATGADVGAWLQTAAKWLILFALSGVGLGTRIEAMRKTGLRPFYVGFAAALTTDRSREGESCLQ